MTTHESRLVSVITVNYNEKQSTQELIDSVSSAGNFELEIIVVDNSTDPAETLENSGDKRYKLVKTKNEGYAAAINKGICTSKGEFLILTNNDIIFPEDSVDCIVDTLLRSPEYGAVSPAIRNSQSKELVFSGFTEINPFTGRNKSLHVLSDNNIEKSHYLHGACMAVRRQVWEEAGGIPEIYFLYYEEVEWSLQIREAGYEIGVAQKCHIYHHESLSTSKMSGLAQYYLYRNRILFHRRNYPWYFQIIFIPYIFLISLPYHSFTHLISGKLQPIRAYFSAISWNLWNKKTIG